MLRETTHHIWKLGLTDTVWEKRYIVYVVLIMMMKWNKDVGGLRCLCRIIIIYGYGVL